MQTALPSRVVAESANLQSGWDTKLQGTQFETTLGGAVIRAGVGDQARADAKIILEGIKSSIHTEIVSSSKSALWQKQAGRGSNIETLQLPSFTGPVAPVLSAPGGYIVDIPKGNLKTEIETLAKQPEYAYLKQLQVAKNVNWNQVQLAYDKWDYKQEGLTGAGAAIIALAVTIVTSGAGTGAALGLNGAAAAATDAAFASLASQASVSLINNKGDVGKTLKELGRSSTVKNLVVAAATAGVADKIGASALNNVSDKQWINNLTVNLANAGSAALINTAVNGGSLKDNLEANILAALVNTAHGEAASKIKQLDHHYIAHKIAHAVAGCAAAAANKGKCQDGAIGAAVGEILGEALLDGRDPGSLNVKDRAKIIAKAKLAAGTVAALSKGDVNTAANAAAVAVENNTLLGDVTREEIEAYRKKFRTEEEAKNNLDIVRNAVVDLAAAGTDGVVGGVDYGIDTLNYVVYCLGFTPGYCAMAKQTLAPKNTAAAEAMISAVNPQTYVKMARTLKDAAEGDAAAKEAAVGFMLSTIKKKPNVKVLDNYLTKSRVSDNISNSQTASRSSNFRQYAAIEGKVSIANIFNSPNSSLKFGNMDIKEMANSANKVNTTRVFDSSKISDAQLRKDVFAYAEKLGNGKLNATKNPNIWNIKTADGATINVRSVSSTSLPDGSKPRWTIDIQGDQKLNSLIKDKMSIRNPDREIKFK